MTLRFISGSNGFIPEATGQVIAYIRKPEEFALNRYVQYVPTPKVVGVYAMLGRDEVVRVVSDEEFAWEDGDERPKGIYHQVPFTWQEFRTFRRDYPWTLGYQAIDQTTGWKPKLVHAAAAISVAMTNRTRRVVVLVETASNWGVNTAAANTLNGGAGPWDKGSDDPSSPAYLAIYSSLIEAAQRIHLATNGKVKPKDLRCVVSPGAAKRMSKAPEMVNYCRESPAARDLVEKGFDPQYDLWGLPKYYKGFEMVVEDTPYVNIRPNTAGFATSGTLHPTEAGSANRLYAKSDTSAAILCRPGSIDGEYGAPSFSTIQVYHHKGLLEVKAFDDPKNERVEGHVEENIKEVLASNVSGFLITGIMS